MSARRLILLAGLVLALWTVRPLVAPGRVCGMPLVQAFRSEPAPGHALEQRLADTKARSGFAPLATSGTALCIDGARDRITGAMIQLMLIGAGVYSGLVIARRTAPAVPRVS